MITNWLTLKQRIMWRIYAIWATRAAMSRTALKTYILLVILWHSTVYVSYTDVWKNHPGLFSDFGREVAFLEGAITNTETVTVILFLGIVILFSWVAFDLVPSLRRRKEK